MSPLTSAAGGVPMAVGPGLTEEKEALRFGVFCCRAESSRSSRGRDGGAADACALRAKRRENVAFPDCEPGLRSRSVYAHSPFRLVISR